MSEPFFKYAGGKRRLLPHILPLLGEPKRYFEPFIGGGAVFLAAPRTKSFVNDANITVAGTWAAVQNDPQGVIGAFYSYAARDSREFYYEVRGLPPGDMVRRAGWFLYLNKAGFNGLIRENAKGQNNVPYGDGKPPKIDEAALMAAHEALQHATVSCGDFEGLTLQPGDVAYCDPPYLPLSKTASFTGYSKGGFKASDQLRLATWARQQANRGGRVIVSNAGTGDSLMAFLKTATSHLRVTASRVISCKGEKRAPVEEYIFIYEPATME